MDQEQLQTAAAASTATEAPEGAQAPSGVPVDQAALGAQEAPAFDWDSDENPYKAKVSEYESKAQKADRLAAENEAFRQQFAQAAKLAEQQRIARHTQEFHDGHIDATEYDRRMKAEIENRDKWWQQQFQPYLTRDWADQTAERHGLSMDERQELYGLDGHAMEFAAQQIVQRRNLVPASKVQELEKRFEQLQRSLAAQSVQNSGVSQTLGGNPSGVGPQPKPGTVEDLRAFLKVKAPSLYQRRTG